MAEGIFNELNLNPLIVEDDNVQDEVEDSQDTLDIDNDDDTDTGSGKGSNDKKKVESTIEVEEDDEDEIPLRNQSDETDDDSDDEKLTGLKQWASFYREKGLIGEEVKDEDITDIETLFEKLQENQLNTATALVESYKSQLPAEIKDLIETWEDGAQGEAFKRVLGIKAEQVEINKLDNEAIKGNVDLQKSVIRNYMKRTTKYDDAKIERYIDKLELVEDLEEEAVTTANELKVILEDEQKEIRETAKQRELTRAAEAKTQREDLQKYIKETKAIIPEINLTDGEKKEIENLIFNPVTKDSQGNPIFYIQKLFNDNPKEMAVKINYLAVITKGFTDYSKLIKKAETKVNKKMEGLLDTPPPRDKKNKQTQDTDSWRDNLKRFRS